MYTQLLKRFQIRNKTLKYLTKFEFYKKYSPKKMHNIVELLNILLRVPFVISKTLLDI